MRINKIILMSVPFDSSYTNVFSDIKPDGTHDSNWVDNLYNKFIDNYNHKELINPNVKSIKRNTLSAEFNIQVDDSVDIFSYNYVITIAGDIKTFWFIDGVRENNSVAGVRNYSIALENDVWSNYQQFIYCEDRPQYIERTHIKQRKNTYPYKPRNNLKVYGNEEVLSNLSIDEVDSSNVTSNIGVDILWLHIKTTKNVKQYELISLDPIELKEFNGTNNWNRPEFLYSSGTLYHYFAPVAMYKHGTNEIINYNKYIISSGDGMPVQPFSLRDMLKVSEDVVDVSYTFNPPFDIYYEFDGTKHHVICNETTLLFVQTNETHSKTVFDGVLGRNDNVQSLATIIGTRTDILNYPSEPSLTTIESSGDFNITNFYKHNPLLHRYPYNFYKVHYGSNDFDLISRLYYEEYSITVTPSADGCYIRTNGGSLSGETYYKNNHLLLLNSPNSLPFATSSGDAYLRNNGEQISTSLQERLARITLTEKKNRFEYQKSIRENVADIAGGVALSYVTGDVSSAVSSIARNAGDIYYSSKEHKLSMEGSELDRTYAQKSYDAKMRDLQNCAYSCSSTGNGDSDVVYQDRITISRHSIEDSLSLHSVYEELLKISLFGFCINEFEYIKNFVMDNFVYIKTVDANLTCTCNLKIKDKLQEILNNGVRCWNINKISNIKVKHMDYNSANYENLEAAYEYIN